MAGRTTNAMFDDIFVVPKLDPDGKKFDKVFYAVSRIEARSQKTRNCEMFIHLDVNTEVYPTAVGDKFTMALAHTLNLDGTPDTGCYTRKNSRRQVRIGHAWKLYKITEEGYGKSTKS